MKNCYTFLRKNWLRFGLASAFSLLSSLIAIGQTAPAKEWDKTIGADAFDAFSVVKQTSDGGYILGGHSYSDSSGDKSQNCLGNMKSDYWVVKTDSKGNKIWDKTFGGNWDDILTCLQQTSDGGFILGGVSESDISIDKTQPRKSFQDIWIIKLDINGNRIWDKVLCGSSNSRSTLDSFQQTSDGGYILAGNSNSGIGGDKSQINNGFSDVWVIKLDASGNKLWDKSFGGNKNEGTNYYDGIIYYGIVSIQQAPNGDFILGATSLSDISSDKSQANKGKNDYWVLKLDASGNKVWGHSFGGSGDDWLYVVQITSDGGYILGGTSDSEISGDKSLASKGGKDYWVIKLDANGNKEWERTIGGNNLDWLRCLVQTPDKSFILGGTSWSDISGDKSQASKGNSDIWLVKIDSNGSKIWDTSLGGLESEAYPSLERTSDGGYILGSYSQSGMSGDKSQSNHGPEPTIADYWILKLAPDPTEKKSECAFRLFPNPAPGKLNLQLCDLISSEVQLTVFDSIGRLIIKEERTAVDNQLTTELNLPVAKGIYLLQIKAGNQTTTRKIVVE
jgi:hypothetical protein